ncbi:unnamed protein product [Symbiodinium sp. CCMP2592]|nr:unnamed protein product [Symbiodinium sp. CCMP2592]
MWLCMVLQWGPCLLVSQLDACSSREDQIEVLGDIMKGKAPSTVLKRARSLTLLHDFVREKSATFPCAESHVYDFLKTLEREGAPPSRLSSVLEAINFTLHVVGVSELAEVSSSRRCKGICTSEFFKEPNQASPLTVQQLQTLHDVLESHPDQWCRAFAGATLVCAYSRCRWSDVQHTETILACRVDLGITDSGKCPFMPAPDAQGKPTVRALDTDEATAWLRLLLQVEDGDTRIASKSMKATMISWAAKRGVDPLTLQRLGYHAAGGMDLVYSRDAQAPLLLVVERLLKEVRDGSFRPDDTRSGRLVTERAQPLVSSFVPEVGGIGGPSVLPQASDVSRVQECKSELGEECSAGEPIVVDSESEPGDSPGESSDESDEDDGQPIALVAQGLVVPAAFLQRCSEVSSDGSLHAALVAQGIRNFRQLAFAIGTPRVEPSAQQYSDLATQVFGASPALGKIAILRDLHFEATTYVIQVFKEQASSDTADVQIKRLPLPERTARALDQQRRLSGVAITGELQPSYNLVDKCNTMLESGALVWLPPSVCSKRDAEVAIGITEKSPVVHLEKDALKLTAPQPKIPVDLSSPLNLMWAWQRRGIAMDQCGLLSWAVHEQYVQRLLNLLTAPVQPPYKSLPTGIKPLDVQVQCPRCQIFLRHMAQAMLLPIQVNNLRLFDALPKSPSPRQSDGCREIDLQFSECAHERGGGVWYQAEDGDVVCPHDSRLKGKILPVDKGDVSLSGTTPGESEHHVHTSWKPVSKDGRFSQAISVYPSLFCQRVAGLLRDSVVKEGASEATSLSEQQIHTPPAARVPLGLQPTRSPGVLPEFGYYVHVIDYVQNSEPTAVAPPKGHFISRHLSTWGDVQAEKRFVQRAVSAGHPRDFVDSLEPALKSVVKENFKAVRMHFTQRFLLTSVSSLNKAVLEKMAVRQEPLLEHATWQATLDELQSGWIWEAPKFEGDFKVYARRFGIVQGDKTRVIDDCSCCGLNATVGTVEKFVVHAIDRMAAMLSYAIDISTEGGAPLCGRTYDLKSAYKQFPVTCADRDILRMFVNRPGQAEPSSVGLNALPFGAIGSVAAFLRISMSVWMLGVLALRVIWTAFFDDYSVVSKESVKQNTAFAVQSLFNLLGLDYAKEGKKAPEFSGVFQMLGLVVDLSQFESRLVKIGHTDKRIAELTRSLDGILEEDRLSAKEAERLRGRMNFFEGHAFGRGPTQAVRNLDRQARVGLLKQGFTGDAKTSLGVLRSRLLSARPLEISPKFSKTWYLFTDGAFENGKGSVGAIFYDQSGVARGAFGSRAPDAFMHRALEYSRNPIYELELVPVLLAFRVWQKVFKCGQLVVYVDNEAAKAALIRACASTPVAELVTESVRLLEESLQLRCWYSRVPSLSNPADAPSRLCFDGIVIGENFFFPPGPPWGSRCRCVGPSLQHLFEGEGTLENIAGDANFLVSKSFEFCQLCVEAGVAFIIEHPEQLGRVQHMVPGSIWDMDESKHLLLSEGVETFAFFQCQWGDALSKKPTRFMAFQVHWDTFTSYDLFLATVGMFMSLFFLERIPMVIGKLRNLLHILLICAIGWPPACLVFALGGVLQQAADVFALCDLVTGEETGRGRRPGELPTEKLFTSGAYVHGGVCGLRKHCRASPWTTALLACIINCVCPGSKFTSVLLGRDIKTGPHRDENNEPGSHNIVVKAASFSRGGLLLEDETGDQEMIVNGQLRQCRVKSPDVEYPFHGYMEAARSYNYGDALTVSWRGLHQSMCDGCGLNSPGRWRPGSRGLGLPWEASDLAQRIHGLLLRFVSENIGDTKKAFFRLALGKMTSAPFSPESMEHLRDEWFRLLPDSKAASKVAEGQPFYLEALSQTSRLLGDEDWGILTRDPESYASGRKVGVDSPFPRVPLVFRPKKKWRNYDDSPYQAINANYSSATLVPDQLEAQFEEEEALGMIFPLSEAEARKRFGDKLHVASLGAIMKDDGTVRTIFDGTHSVKLNNRIRIDDHLEFPGPSCVGRAMEEMEDEDYHLLIGLAADVAKGHRRFKHRSEDHGYLGCRAREDGPIWFNRVGTFGMACAAYHFARLVGLIGRCALTVLMTSPLFQFLFADDLKFFSGGPRKYDHVWTILVFWLMVGTPFKWSKFRGGVQLDYVGFAFDYFRFSMGLSERRANWIIEYVNAARRDRGLLDHRRFVEFVGRLVYAGQVLYWLRPFMAPLHRWKGAQVPGTVAVAPRLVMITLEYIRSMLLEGHAQVSCRGARPAEAESFRTDAKAAEDFYVLGGWETCHSLDPGRARWFSLKVHAQEIPALFNDRGTAEGMSTVAELLATLVALHAFGWLETRGRCFSVSAGTDNLANETVTAKNSTLKFPLAYVQMQLSHSLYKCGGHLKLNWRPREVNTIADDLTNESFGAFDPNLRIHVCLNDCDLSLLRKLSQHHDEVSSWSQRGVCSAPSSLRKRKDKYDKTKWG